MTKRELEWAKNIFQERWAQALYQKKLAEEKPERKSIAKEAEDIACGYMDAVADILGVSKGTAKASSIVRAWADEVEEKKGAVLE
jgi:hypothetical protein